MNQIIHVLPSLGESGGGPPRSVSQLCGALVGLDAKVGIITAFQVHDPMVPLNDAIKLTTLEGKGTSFWERLIAANFGKALHQLHEKNPISLLHQHGIWLRSSHATTSFAHKNKVPLVVAPRGMLEPWAMQHNRSKKTLAWMLYQKSDLKKATAFHATAHSEAESIRRLGFKQPIAVIPNGVEFPLFKPSIGSKDKESTFEDAKKTALFLSRIHPKKGLPMLLNAWKAVAPKDWNLLIAGNDDGGYVQTLLEQIQHLGLSDQVQFVGSLFGEAKQQAYENADLFVLPSYSENFGIVVAEALSYGVPVLTTKGCPWQELETEKCGWWVEPTLEDIQEGLGKALSTPASQLKIMGESGRQLIEKKYQWDGIAARMQTFYQWLLSGGETPEFVV